MIQISGMRAVRSALLRVTDEGAKTTSREVVRSLLNIQRGAKERSRVDTGRQRNSIAVAETEYDIPVTEGTEVARNQIRAGMLSGVVGTNVDYAPHNEFGTARMSAQPFMFPAYEEERPKFIQRLQRELGEAFVKING